MFVHEMYGFWDALKNNSHEGGTVIETLSKIIDPKISIDESR